MKKILIAIITIIAVFASTMLVVTYESLKEAQAQISQLQIPEANSSNSQTGIVYLLGSSNVYNSFDDALQKKQEAGKLAQGDMLSQLASLGKLFYMQGRIYGIKYNRVLTQEIPGKPVQTVYQVGELFIIPDVSE